MSIKRYDKDYYGCACGGCIIEPNEYGDYVFYRDYLKEVENLHNENKQLQNENKQLQTDLIRARLETNRILEAWRELGETIEKEKCLLNSTDKEIPIK